MNRLILSWGLIVLSSDLLATERVYQADVEGMVCAFCAYAVSRDLAGKPVLDLKLGRAFWPGGKRINFHST